MNETFFPRFLDKPRLIGFFEIDEFFIVFGMIVFVLFLSLAFPITSLIAILGGIALGLVVNFFYRKYKKNKPDGFAYHSLYRLGIFHPQDNKAYYIGRAYLTRRKICPYGFTKKIIN